MCFSAQASFIASGILGTIGILAITKTKLKKLILIASTPLFFAIQQAIEGIVWLTINSGNTSGLLHKFAVYGFIFFASTFWPTAIPITLFFIEQNKTRKKLLLITSCMGILFATAYIICWILMGIKAEAIDHHIAYSFANNKIDSHAFFFLENIGLTIYVIATSGAMLISSINYMWVLGVLTIIALIISQIFYYLAFGSVWCFFAAIISLLIYFIVTFYRNKN